MTWRNLLRPASSFRKTGDVLDFGGVVLLSLYVLAGLSYAYLLAPAIRFPDEGDYLALARNLLHGIGFSLDGVHLTASRPPGYPFFLCSIEALGGGLFCVRALQFILLGGTVVLISRLASGQKMFAGLLIATGLVICYPVLFYTSGTLYAQTFGEFLFILALTLMLADRRGFVLNTGTGFVFGGLILTVPTFLITMVVTLGTAWLLKMVRLREVVLVVLAAGLLVGVWTVRNAVYLHHFVPVASNSGLNFLVGNNGTTKAYEGAVSEGMTPYYEQAGRLGLDEFQSDSFYWHAAFAYIGRHPLQAFIHYLERVLNFFNIVNVYAGQNRAELSAGKQVVMGLSYAVLLGLLGWRLIEVRRYPLLNREKLLLAVYFLSAFTSAIFLTRIRLRLPYDFLIIAVIALHLSRRWRDWAERKSQLP